MPCGRVSSRLASPPTRIESAPELRNIKTPGSTVAAGVGKARVAVTLSTAIYRELRADILAARLQPGMRLRLGVLGARFSSASSAVREALNRLVAEGFVLVEDQKGFQVAPVSEDELKELVIARCLVDGAAVTEGIRARDPAWEEQLVLALHRLSRANRWAVAGAVTPDPEWERLHREFHLALTGGCGSRWIRRISGQLFDAAERYRLVAAPLIQEGHELDEHRAIVDACLAHNAKEAAALLKEHYGKTFAVIMDSANAPQG